MPNEVEPINPTTFCIRLVEDEVEIGDIDAPVFIPHARLKRWGGECSLGVKPAGEITEVELEVEQYKVKSKFKVSQNGFDLELESEFEGLAPETIAYGEDENGDPVEFVQNELGAFELNIILAKKPPTNRLVFDIEVQGLAFYYQSPLHPAHPTWREDEPGLYSYGPWNGVGSYAVYHATKCNHILGQTNYMAGKAYHIYRPRIEDAIGTWVWGELDIDVQAGTLTVTIPQDFLDTATYPIRHAAGQQFGYTTAGAFWANSNDYIRAFIAAGVAGTGVSISFYGRRYLRYPWKGALYKESDDSFVKNTVEGTGGGGNSWRTAIFSPASPTIEDINYYICGHFDSMTIWYDMNGVAKNYQARTYEDGWPTPLNLSTSTETRYSLYCTYTPAAGGGSGSGDGLAAAAATLLA